MSCSRSSRADSIRVNILNEWVKEPEAQKELKKSSSAPALLMNLKISQNSQKIARKIEKIISKSDTTYLWSLFRPNGSYINVYKGGYFNSYIYIIPSDNPPTNMKPRKDFEFARPFITGRRNQ